MYCTFCHLWWPQNCSTITILPHFLQNSGVDGKIFEERFFILTTWTIFLQIVSKYVVKFSRRHCQKPRLEQTTSSAHIFSKIFDLNNASSNLFQNVFSRRHFQKSEISTRLGWNELIILSSSDNYNTMNDIIPVILITHKRIVWVLTPPPPGMGAARHHNSLVSFCQCRTIQGWCDYNSIMSFQWWAKFQI
jgi:hypothetical protein